MNHTANNATNIDPINLLTLERTFCVYCFQMGLRPKTHPTGVLDGVRFGRSVAESPSKRFHRILKTRGRVLHHLVAEHYGIAQHLFPSFTEAHPPVPAQ